MIPIFSELLDSEQSDIDLSPTSVLLSGPPGNDKELFCKKFLEDGLKLNGNCIYASSKLTHKYVKSLLGNDFDIPQFKFVNLSFYDQNIKSEIHDKDLILDHILNELLLLLKTDRHNWWESQSRSKNKKIFFVLDSIDHLFLLYKKDNVIDFLNKLFALLNQYEIYGIFTINTPITQENQFIINMFNSLLEIKTEECKDNITKSIRLVSYPGVRTNSSWTIYEIDKESNFTIGGPQLQCTLCKHTIVGNIEYYRDIPFCSKQHLSVYKKISMISEDIRNTHTVIDGHFFFIDIVGLSNPRLPVMKQKEKIEKLNEMIESCKTYSYNVGEKIVLLPTGDGMVIGFKSNPIIPIELSIQLHEQLKKYNLRKTEEDRIHIRIGLNSGPVFFLNDLNNNKNVWGPGIILARRVMDLGDSEHILITETLAENLIVLDNWYKKIIKFAGYHEIKHGQKIKVYLAASENFGNVTIPKILT